MASTQTNSRLTQLSSTILKSVAELEEKLSVQGYPSPSFNEDAPALFPKDIFEVRDLIIDSAAEIQDLLQGPLDLIYRHGSFNNCVSIQAITRFNIAALVPPGGRTTYVDIAKQTGLGEQEVRRVLRHAMTMRLFREPEPGVVAHTQASKALMDPVANDWAACGTEEMWPAATKMVDAMQRWPGSQEPNQTAFALANGTEKSIYQVLGGDPRRAQRFGNTMKAHMMTQEYNVSHVVDNFDWESLGHVQLVDVGGGVGHVSMQLARSFPNISVIVQDMEKMIEEANKNIPVDLKDRFKYMVYDMFESQTVQADVYFFRWVLHNWSDKYCTLILKALIPALKPGVRIIINETCMPEPGVISHWREKYLRSVDLNMGAGFAACERGIDEWKELVTGVDSRFVFQGVNQPRDSALAIIEFVWAKE